MNDSTLQQAADPFAPLVAEGGQARDINLSELLAAWESATERLRKTHETLREEVHRLTGELQVKNRELARKNRLADLGQMASHIAHEVRNNLTPLTLYLSLLERYTAGNAKTQDLVNKIEKGFSAMDATVSDLLHFTSDRDPIWQQFRLRELVCEVVDPFHTQLAAQDISLAIDVPQFLVVWADRQLVRRAALNLVLNAIDMMPDGGELVITSCETHAGWELEIADSGPGLPAELKERIFEPFVTNKSNGTGLGLAVVYRMAQLHGGSIVAMDCPEGGAAFTLRIPSHMPQEAAA